jgi:hypothetical protein
MDLVIGRFPPIFFMGLLLIGKRYLEILENSELMIEKSIIQRQQQQLNAFFMNQTDATIVYSVQEEESTDLSMRDILLKSKVVTLEIYNKAAEAFTGLKLDDP